MELIVYLKTDDPILIEVVAGSIINNYIFSIKFIFL
jgi:hypothetical protein